eukprot:15463210-Alexandrium_andersonii.AAC.1
MSGPGVVNCAAYGMHDTVKMFHCSARAAGDCLAAAIASARSVTSLQGPAQVPARVARPASADQSAGRGYGPSPCGEQT